MLSHRMTSDHELEQAASLLLSLISNVAYQESDMTWKGLKVTATPEAVARKLLFPVTEAYLNFGEVRRARRTLDATHPSIRTTPEYLRLEHSVKDFEEAQTLGFSVRPREMPHDVRWQPTVLPDPYNGHTLERWYPGRITAVTSEGVTVISATPHPDPRARRMLKNDLSHLDWRNWSRIHPQVDLFVEIGEYSGNGGVLILPVST